MNKWLRIDKTDLSTYVVDRAYVAERIRDLYAEPEETARFCEESGEALQTAFAIYRPVMSVPEKTGGAK